MLQIENLHPFFQDDSLVILKKLNRLNRFGKRYYFDENLQFKIGITSFLSETMKTPYFLEQWKANNSPEIVKERAEHGTKFHIHAANILRQKKLNALSFDLSICESDEILKDIIAFINFVEKYNPDPILLESQVYSTEMDLAATLDFFGYVDMPVKGLWGEVYKSGEKKGEPKETSIIKRTLCIIDFKTAIKHEEIETDKPISMYNKLQLNFQLLMLLEMFPQFLNSNVKLFNVITKNWRTNPEMQIAKIELIPGEILKSYYNSCRYIYPELFNIGEMKVIDFNSTEKYSGENFNSLYSVTTIKDYCKQLIF